MLLFFFFNDTATTEIYTLSLHDALPIYPNWRDHNADFYQAPAHEARDSEHDVKGKMGHDDSRSEEHTSELQSLAYLVCRLLLEKKKNSATRHLPAQRRTSRS